MTTTLIAAVVGVVVGAMLRGLIEPKFELQRQRDAARGAARLLLEDLHDASDYLRDCGTMPVTEVAWSVRETSLTAWNDHGAALAVGMRAAEWATLVGPLRLLRKWNAEVGQVEAVGPE